MPSATPLSGKRFAAGRGAPPMPRFGILGGMGPAATILLQQRILDSVTAARDADHIPLLVNMNPQVPSRIDFLIKGRGDSPGPVLARMARELEACDVDAIAMPCCTAHHFAPEIEAATAVPFLNMVQLTAHEVATRLPAGSRIGILASPATKKIGLFERALASHGLSALYPRDDAPTLRAIESIKSVGVNADNVSLVQNTIEELTAQGAQAFIVGCSEFSLISRELTALTPIIDALDVLTAAINGFAGVQKPAVGPLETAGLGQCHGAA